VTLYRCFAWRVEAKSDAADGALWFPRPFQGEGRHDNPDLYGCLYLADRPLSCIVEQFAPFRGQRLIASMLQRRGLPLALGSVEIADTVALIDLDDPRQLSRERLRPSLVATRNRAVTQPQVRLLYHRHPFVGGLRWWSSWEGQWMNVTLFDRASRAMRLAEVELLTLEHPAVVEAAEFFGFRPA